MERGHCLGKKRVQEPPSFPARLSLSPSPPHALWSIARLRLYLGQVNTQADPPLSPPPFARQVKRSPPSPPLSSLGFGKKSSSKSRLHHLCLSLPVAAAAAAVWLKEEEEEEEEEEEKFSLYNSVSLCSHRRNREEEGEATKCVGREGEKQVTSDFFFCVCGFET